MTDFSAAGSACTHEEFYAIIGDIAESVQFRKLAEYPQHFGVSRMHHSINVAYLSYKAAKRLGLDYCSAARGGMLHDLFHYCWKEKKLGVFGHAFFHPVEALSNSEELTELNDIEKDAIITHMWPLGRLPRYKESFIVCLADDVSIFFELAHALKIKKNERKKVRWRENHGG